MGEKRIFPVESVRIFSSPLEIPARLEVCKTLLLTGPAEHKADTSGPVRSPCRRAAEAPGKLTSNGAGVPFLTGSRISQAQNERRSRTNFVF